MDDKIRAEAIDYHRLPTPGKLEITPTKPLANQYDLALAYSPGVAAACDAIAQDESQARELTARGNLVAVVTNGTAVLGLGNIGPLAAKPVMEGKACLFKKFAGIDVFDIEINASNVEEIVTVVSALEPTFGAINLEDIKAPECFEVERKLQDRLNIPVFHDDQHGTAIIVGAAMLNALRLVGKNIQEIRLIASGAGAAGLACLDLLVSLGLRRENILVADRHGIIYEGRDQDMNPEKATYARKTEFRTLADATVECDAFLGLSAPGILTEAMVKSMADNPIIFALANPTPEILPEIVKRIRSDAIIATGRSDYPNQVNNVLCFPFIFRGALDVGARTVNSEMKLACVRAIASLAMAEPSDVVAAAYSEQAQSFGRNYLIPKPFDPRLIIEIASAVAEAAMSSGVATRPLDDLEAYRRRLANFVFKSGSAMKTIFQKARDEPKRIVYTDGESERVLRAVQLVVDEHVAQPILVGRPEVIAMRLEKYGLRMQPGKDFELVNPHQDSRYKEYWNEYHSLMARKGGTPSVSRNIVRTNTTVIGAIMVRRGEADGMICGVEGRFKDHVKHIGDLIGLRPGVSCLYAMNSLLTGNGMLFICDTNVVHDPSAEQIAEMTILAAEEVSRFGVRPKIALLSHSNFGESDESSAIKMSKAKVFLQNREPNLNVEGEMHGDAALSSTIREKIIGYSEFEGEANLLVMPTLDAAHISFNLLKSVTNTVSIGPILLGTASSAYIVGSNASTRRILNMTALCVAGATSKTQQFTLKI